MKTVELGKVIREFDEMVYTKTCWFNEAVLNGDKLDALVNSLSILDLVTLRCNITGESYDKIADEYYNPIKIRYENEFLKKGE